MYFGKKRNYKAVLAVVITAIVLIFALVLFLRAMNQRRKKAIDMSAQGTSIEAMTEVYCHLTVKENSDGEVSYNPAAKLSGNSKETVYSVLASDSIELQIVPVEGKLFDYAEIATDHGEYVTADRTENGIRFLMPPVNATATIYYMDDEEWILAHMETETETETQRETEPETETEESVVHMYSGIPQETETEAQAGMETEKETEPEYNTYGMKLYNATEANTKDFGNPFIAEKLLQNIGEDFGVGDPASYYYDITKVTFSDKLPEQEEGTVNRYLYFEDDEEWLILGTFYPASGIYFFEDTTDRVSQARNDLGTLEQETASSGSALNNNNSYSSGNSYGGVSYSAPQTVTTTVSLNLQNVSTVFLSFVGNDQGFVDQITDYVYSTGVSGNVVGNFLEYTIDPDAQTASFSIYINTGGIIEGVYDKNSNTYSLSGL